MGVICSRIGARILTQDRLLASGVPKSIGLATSSCTGCQPFQYFSFSLEKSLGFYSMDFWGSEVFPGCSSLQDYDECLLSHSFGPCFVRWVVAGEDCWGVRGVIFGASGLLWGSSGLPLLVCCLVAGEDCRSVPGDILVPAGLLWSPLGCSGAPLGCLWALWCFLF